MILREMILLEVNNIINGVKKPVESRLLLSINFSQKREQKQVISEIKKDIKKCCDGVKEVEVILSNGLPLTSLGYPVSDLLQRKFNFKVIDQLIVNKYY